jgi:hypothetical protein
VEESQGGKCGWRKQRLTQSALFAEK